MIATVAGGGGAAAAIDFWTHRVPNPLTVLVGATGAGDVKLFAAVGALIGPAPVATAFLYTAIAGGVMALIIALRRKRLRQTIGGTARLIATAAANVSAIESPLEHNRFAYAPAIAVGATLAALGL